jgi:hypothetical protein
MGFHKRYPTKDGRPAKEDGNPYLKNISKTMRAMDVAKKMELE